MHRGHIRIPALAIVAVNRFDSVARLNFRRSNFRHGMAAHSLQSVLLSRGRRPYWRFMRVALFQPEIAGNVGAVIRLCACMGTPLDIIEPCGFPFSDRSLKRAGMDYVDGVQLVRHSDWDAFKAAAPGRIILLTTKGDTPLTNAGFVASDTLLFGKESAGVPIDIRAACDVRVVVGMAGGFRSLNLAVTAGIALHEALRQTGELPQ